MPPAAIGPVKAMLLELDLKDLEAELHPILSAGEPVPDLRRRLMAYAESRGVPL
jgi:phosphotransferase system enzyme I (PtsP)